MDSEGLKTVFIYSSTDVLTDNFDLYSLGVALLLKPKAWAKNDAYLHSFKVTTTSGLVKHGHSIPDCSTSSGTMIFYTQNETLIEIKVYMWPWDSSLSPKAQLRLQLQKVSNQ